MEKQVCPKSKNMSTNASMAKKWLCTGPREVTVTVAAKKSTEIYTGLWDM